jgi:hypothetical protein
MIHELTIQIYEGNGEITTNGYYKNNMGMIYFIDEYSIEGIRGNSKLVAKTITKLLMGNLKKNINLPFIDFKYGNMNRSITTFADGFFGRPKVCTGATLLKPLQERRKDALTRELNKIKTIQDKKGKTIELKV